MTIVYEMCIGFRTVEATGSYERTSVHVGGRGALPEKTQ